VCDATISYAELNAVSSFRRDEGTVETPSAKTDMHNSLLWATFQRFVGGGLPASYVFTLFKSQQFCVRYHACEKSGVLLSDHKGRTQTGDYDPPRDPYRSPGLSSKANT